MILDVIAIFLILLFVFLGFKNGFVHTLFNSVGWILAIILAMLFNSWFRDFLSNNTTMYDRLSMHVEDVTSKYIDKYLVDDTSILPSIIDYAINEISEMAKLEIAQAVTEAIFLILSFVLLLVIFKLIFFIITVLISRKYHHGFIGGMDALSGALLGAVQGILVVLILLAVIVPTSFLMNPNWYSWVTTSLDRSIITGAIYEANPLKIIIEGYLPEEFIPSKINVEDLDIIPNLDDMH